MRTDTTVDALSWRKSRLLETCERAAKKIRSRRSLAEERATFDDSGVRGPVEHGTTNMTFLPRLVPRQAGSDTALSA
jgi:hypothetical protein